MSNGRSRRSGIVDRLGLDDLNELMGALNGTAEFFGDLISIMALAFERLRVSAKRLGHDMSQWQT